MSFANGPSGYLLIGDNAIPVTSWSIETRPARAKDNPVRGVTIEPPAITCTLTWDIPPVVLADYLAALESRRWSDYITRRFRGMPGMRFADLMRGPGRN